MLNEWVAVFTLERSMDPWTCLIMNILVFWSLVPIFTFVSTPVSSFHPLIMTSPLHHLSPFDVLLFRWLFEPAM